MILIFIHQKWSEKQKHHSNVALNGPSGHPFKVITRKQGPAKPPSEIFACCKIFVNRVFNLGGSQGGAQNLQKKNGETSTTLKSHPIPAPPKRCQYDPEGWLMGTPYH